MNNKKNEKMKSNMKIVLLISAVALLVGCGPSIRVTDAWKSDDVKDAKNETFLVIVRTDSRSSRQILENNIAEQLRAEGVDAIESYTKYPTIQVNKKVSEEEINEVVATITNDGYEIVVLTVLRDVTSELVTEQSGGYYTGGYGGGYGGYYGGFGGYYGRYYSPYGMGGMYVPATETTYTQDVYKLETVVYDLRKDSNNQLIAVVGVDITDPVSTSQIAEDYAKKVVERFK